MWKKVVTTLIVICLIAAFVPSFSRAVISPHFVAVNDTLLPFSDDTMPFISGGVIYVPYNVFSLAGITTSTSEGSDRVRLQRGSTRVDFYPTYGFTEDPQSDILDWPPARRSGGRVYVPLHEVCGFFYLRYELIEVGRSVIPDMQIWVIRIMTGSVSGSGDFVDRNRDTMLSAYNSYYAPSNGTAGTAPPVELPPPSYADVTVYLSFYDLSSGSVDGVLDLLGELAASGLRCCFFVDAAVIRKDPGLIRKLHGSGQAVGIWLETGELEEYNEVSACLFEAAKIKTVLISSGKAAEAAVKLADANGLVYWGAEVADGLDETDVPDEPEPEPELTASAAIDLLPTEGGERAHLSFPCSEDAALVLPEVLAHLSEYEYSLAGIAETVAPVRCAAVAG